MPSVQEVTKRFEFLPKPSLSVMPVVQMDLHLAVSLTTELRQPVQNVLIVFLLRVEESVAGRPPVRIEETSDRGRIG
jgi:hypothetical protein